MLELRGVNTFYGSIPALRDVSLSVREGEIVTLIGANGAGKTTTLMTVCGGIQPRSGEILYEGKPIHRTRPNEIVRMGISQVPEGRLIFPELTVQENLDMGAFLRRDRDPIIIQQIFGIIQKINHDGTTVFLVEQNANQALKIAHRGYVMENCRVVMENSASALLNDQAVRKAYLGM